MSYFGTTDYMLEVSRGNVPGASIAFVIGRNNAVGIANSETIWDYGGNYPYLTADTQLYISSSDALDTDVDVVITGLTLDGSPVTRIVNTNGFTQTAISGLVYRVLAAFIPPTSNNGPVGDLYLAQADGTVNGVPLTASNVKGLIPLSRNSAGALIDQSTDYASDNFTHLGTYTVPAGKTAYLVDSFFFAGKNADVTISGRVRLKGGVWFNRTPSELYQSAANFSFSTRLPLPENTDLEYRAIAGNVNTTVNFQVQLLLLDNV